MSPLLFKVYIDTVIKEVKMREREGRSKNFGGGERVVSCMQMTCVCMASLKKA